MGSRPLVCGEPAGLGIGPRIPAEWEKGKVRRAIKASLWLAIRAGGLPCLDFVHVTTGCCSGHNFKNNNSLQL